MHKHTDTLIDPTPPISMHRGEIRQKEFVVGKSLQTVQHDTAAQCFLPTPGHKSKTQQLYGML